MKAIIIDNKDACNLLDLLKLEKYQAEQFKSGEISRLCEIYKIDPKAIGPLLNNIHGSFHFIVCRWLQEQGASCVR